MERANLIPIGLALATSVATGCGLDWTLPQAHFAGVDEQGHVAYWEKIGEADLAGGLVIPVNIGFNSQRESSSPYLGKGWIVALLESHVEPVDENTMHVIMPDGWGFNFYRNGNTETWRGDAGWVGETNDTIFTIAAPCGWRIKFDGGKIQEIDSNTNRTFTYRYTGGVATEIDEGSKPLIQVDSNMSTNPAQYFVIGDQKVAICLAQRPRVGSKDGQLLLTGFDQSLNKVTWPDGDTESFTFGVSKDLSPNLVLAGDNTAPEEFVWDATTRQIKTDGVWTYSFLNQSNSPQDFALVRTDASHQTESWERDLNKGIETILTKDGKKIITKWFVAGPLFRKIRSIDIFNSNDLTYFENYSYTDRGEITRIRTSLGITEYTLDENGRKNEILYNNKKVWQCSYDESGRRTNEVWFYPDGKLK